MVTIYGCAGSASVPFHSFTTIDLAEEYYHRHIVVAANAAVERVEIRHGATGDTLRVLYDSKWRH